MSDTPRTTALLVDSRYSQQSTGHSGFDGFIERLIDHARDLERELAATVDRLTVIGAAQECDKLGEEYDNKVATCERSGPSAPGYVRDHTFYSWVGAASAYRRSAAIIRKAMIAALSGAPGEK